jgi:DNA-binding MarR family transcriptional regulator
MSGGAGESVTSGALGEIDRLIHEPARFAIMAHLYVVEKADFTFLLNQTGLTRGNLSSHISKLEDAGYVAVDKKFVARKPLTVLSLTDAGRASFLEYRRKMQQVLAGLPK